MQLTDAQVITICIAFILPLSALIHSNSRVSDTRAALSKQMDDTRERLLAEIQALRNEMIAEFKAVRAEMQGGFKSAADALRIHELEHHK